MKTNKWQIIGIYFIGIAVLASGIFIGLSVKSMRDPSPLMTIEQASEYTNISVEEIEDIIIWEDAHPEFFDASIMKLPYFTVEGEKYFTTRDLTAWVHNVSTRPALNKFISLSHGWGEK